MGEETTTGAEARRLEESRLRQKHWKRWGPYISERAWGTVREDYSREGTAWESFPHDHARARAYRWGEDGIAGICDNHQRLCLALGLWNGRDPILKERLFGLTGNEGSNGEDVKEYYFYLDSTPTHSYMRFLYKYPQAAFPYAELVRRNAERGRRDGEFELLDTGVFEGGHYYDVFVEYAKAGVDDIAMRVVAHNRGDRDETLHLLPSLWCRRTWEGGDADRPRLFEGRSADGIAVVDAEFPAWNKWRLYCAGQPRLLFTENETNRQRLWGQPNAAPYVKDGIERWLLHGEEGAVNRGQAGTKAAAHYKLEIPARGQAEIRLRLSSDDALEDACGEPFEWVFNERHAEADAFYAPIGCGLGAEGRAVQRQALAGLLWSKQFYHYDVSAWLKGDAEHHAPGPPAGRRNAKWGHLYNEDIVSMPDKWEYPWYASWDLAFHCIPLALVDIDFAKEQLLLFLREWYMHPNGQVPAYEWAFDDVNPPVHAWAVWRVYKIEKRQRGRADRAFLERAFHKLLLNFNWWVNRKDAAGNNIFEGGFLGLDNIGVFDRSAPLPTGGTIEQADGTSWMGMYCLNMLAIALELARENRAYSDVASKFFEHFVYISDAINHVGDDIELWDEEDGFFYDALTLPDGSHQRLKIRSMVGLITLFAVEALDPEAVDALPGFRRRLEWFIENRPHLQKHIAFRRRDCADGASPRRLLAIVGRERLRRVLRPMLDEAEFLSPYGIRGLSRRHREHPFVFEVGGAEYRVDYEPAESASGMFGGNSNWRGPVWFPVNFLIIESLQKFHYYYGDGFKVECPTGSGNMLSLWEVAAELSRRLCRLFLPGEGGGRPVNRRHPIFDSNPQWRDCVLFYEYFHGDDGTGLGASHQTGWTALVAKLLQQSGEGL